MWVMANATAHSRREMWLITKGSSLQRILGQFKVTASRRISIPHFGIREPKRARISEMRDQMRQL